MATTKKRKKRATTPVKRRKSSHPRVRRRRNRSLSDSGGGHSVTSVAGLHKLLVHAIKHTVSAAGGGYGAALTNRWIPPTTGKLAIIGITLAVGVAGAYFGYPVTSAGYVGGMTATRIAPNGSLADDSNANFADENVLSDMPLFLDDNNNPMVLDENDPSGFRYLSDEEIEVMEEQGMFTAYNEL